MRTEESLPIRPAPWSLTLGQIRGIPVHIHASFLLLLVWVVTEESEFNSAFVEIIFILGIFASVVAHELGHLLVAKQFGLTTREVILYPFGGVASFLGTPSPRAAFWISLAGPAVNFVIATLIFLSVDWHGWKTFLTPGDFRIKMLAANIVLAGFNLIPALPLDGGRALRAILATLRIPRAIAIATRLSQALSLVLGVTAIYYENPFLVVISIFVFTSAMRELVQERSRLGAEGKIIQDVMIERGKILTLSHAMTLSQALDVALRSVQPVFPVVFGEQIMGTISRDAILRDAVVAEEETYLSGLMQRNFVHCGSQEPVDTVITLLQENNIDALLVIDDEKLVGMVYQDQLFEYLYLHGVRKARAEQITESSDEYPDI